MMTTATMDRISRSRSQGTTIAKRTAQVRAGWSETTRRQRAALGDQRRRELLAQILPELRCEEF